MFCPNCGTMIPDNTSVCPTCGGTAGASHEHAGTGLSGIPFDGSGRWGRVDAQGSGLRNNTNSTFGSDSAANFNTNPGGIQPPIIKLKEDRSIWMYILLTIVTCGIYPFIFVYQLVEDVNVALDGDGEETPGLVKYILLSLLTCGIYRLIWEYNLGNRLAKNGPRYGLNIQENGTTVLMWILLGSFLCGLGPIIAWHILIKNTNMICQAYNRSHGN